MYSSLDIYKSEKRKFKISVHWLHCENVYVSTAGADFAFYVKIVVSFSFKTFFSLNCNYNGGDCI